MVIKETCYISFPYKLEIAVIN